MTRAPARALVDCLFNGDPPWSEREAEENHIHLNCNFGEASDLLLQARQQYENALLTTGNFFSVKLPDAPPSKREKYEATITNNANRALKKSLAYLHTQRQKVGSMALHGPGPQAWEDSDNPVPYFVPVPDLLIPTDTDITLNNLPCFAIRRKMTPLQLHRKTLNRGKNVDPGWDLQAVRRLLNAYKDINQNPNNYDWANYPEQMQEILKQDQQWWETDSAPSIWAWDFYYQEDDQDDKSWQRTMILDKDCIAGTANDASKPVQLLFKSKTPFAQDIGQILHVNFSDGNNVPPFMYHSCRGVGVRLYDSAQIKNRLMCQFLQKVFEDMMLLFRANDPSDKARLNEIFLGMLYGVIPEGLAMVKQDERYQIDANLVEMAMNNLKQNMGEGSAAYTQNVDTTDKKERTAFEVNTLLNQATKITSGMINLAYLQEDFAYTEIMRRFFKQGTSNFMAKKFQNACLEECGHGIEKWMNIDRCDVSSERVMGAGNSQIELGQANALQAIRPTLNPKGQAIVTNRYVFAVTHDPKLTEEIAPRDGAPGVSNTQHDSQIAFGVLMSGYPLQPVPGLNPTEVITTIVPLMEAEVKNVMQSGGVGTPDHIKGLMNCAQYVGGYLQELSADKSNAQFVKMWGDRLGKVMNEVKAFGQRQQQAAQKQNGNGAPAVDPEKMADLQFKQAADAQKLKSKEQSHRQRIAHKQQDFEASQQQKKAQALNDITLKTAEATAKPRSVTPGPSGE